jgi:hypothetical protein
MNMRVGLGVTDIWENKLPAKNEPNDEEPVTEIFTYSCYWNLTSSFVRENKKELPFHD